MCERHPALFRRPSQVNPSTLCTNRFCIRDRQHRITLHRTGRAVPTRADASARRGSELQRRLLEHNARNSQRCRRIRAQYSRLALACRWSICARILFIFLHAPQLLVMAGLIRAAGYVLAAVIFTSGHILTCLSGDPTAKIGSPLLMRYQQGITAMGKAGVVRAAISVIVAATYPRLLEQIGAPLLIFIVFGTYGVIMCMFASTHNINNGQFTVAAYSVPMTILLTIPMAITVKKSSRTNRGK